MKAIDFIREFGWEYAQHILSGDAPFVVDLDYNDLKQYVDAWVVIGKHRGLDEARKDLVDAKYLGMIEMIFGTKLTNLEKAIQLVENVENKND